MQQERPYYTLSRPVGGVDTAFRVKFNWNIFGSAQRDKDGHDVKHASIGTIVEPEEMANNETEARQLFAARIAIAGEIRDAAVGYGVSGDGSPEEFAEFYKKKGEIPEDIRPVDYIGLAEEPRLGDDDEIFEKLDNAMASLGAETKTEAVETITHGEQLRMAAKRNKSRESP